MAKDRGTAMATTKASRQPRVKANRATTVSTAKNSEFISSSPLAWAVWPWLRVTVSSTPAGNSCFFSFSARARMSPATLTALVPRFLARAMVTAFWPWAWAGLS